MREAFDVYRSDAEKRQTIGSLAPDRSALGEQVEWLTSRIDAGRSGRQRFVMTGFATMSYADHEGSNSNFSAAFSPVFLFRMTDRILLEAELSARAGGEEDEVELEYAQASYVATDWLTLAGGKFLSPFGSFQERLHPSWINKLPSNPLIYGHDGALGPEGMLGAQARGAIPVNDSGGKVTYAVWMSNGPGLVDEGEEAEDGTSRTGLLDYESGRDNNNDKSFGTRLAYIPVPGIEIGGSYWGGQAGASGGEFRDVDFRLLGADFVAQWRDVDAVSGHVEVRSEWIWSDVDNNNLSYNNRRDGGYVQVAYRPHVDAAGSVLNDFEAAVRYDKLDVPGGAPQNDMSGWTVGLSYWMSPTSVLKFAVELRDVDDESDQTNVLVQWGLAF